MSTELVAAISSKRLGGVKPLLVQAEKLGVVLRGLYRAESDQLTSERGRTDEMVERIRSLLARFSESEDTVRQLVATDASFDALCDEYRVVSKLLAGIEVEARRLRERQAKIEEDLLTHIEGYQPQ